MVESQYGDQIPSPRQFLAETGHFFIENSSCPRKFQRVIFKYAENNQTEVEAPFEFDVSMDLLVDGELEMGRFAAFQREDGQILLVGQVKGQRTFEPVDDPPGVDLANVQIVEAIEEITEPYPEHSGNQFDGRILF